MIDLSVNLNKIALIRNSREGNYPDILKHAEICIGAGANGITVHPRRDLRHIRPKDVRQLSALLKKYPNVEFNVEGNPLAKPKGDYPGFIPLVLETCPEQCTLVPDSDKQLTSDHGFDLRNSGQKLIPVIEKLKAAGIRVSLFMDPDLEQIALAKDIGADRIELYTGPFAAAWPKPVLRKALFQQHCAAAELAAKLGLGINAGHDLNLDNLSLYKTLPGLQEVSIGHALTVDALAMGLSKAVTAYKLALR